MCIIANLCTLNIQGASGVGLAAIQLAKVLFKATKVIATAGKHINMA